MTIALEKIDSVPLMNENFSFEFNSWLSVLVDTLNEIIDDIQTAFDLLEAPSYTSAEITLLNPELPNGILVYDSDLHVYVGKENGSLVKFTTSAYP